MVPYCLLEELLNSFSTGTAQSLRQSRQRGQKETHPNDSRLSRATGTPATVEVMLLGSVEPRRFGDSTGSGIPVRQQDGSIMEET